eukprot:1146285-Pelagomonas_calceolata.AAC.1
MQIYLLPERLNRMGDEGCKVVCDALKTNPSLGSLNLAANSAGKVGIGRDWQGAAKSVILCEWKRKECDGAYHFDGPGLVSFVTVKTRALACSTFQRIGYRNKEGEECRKHPQHKGRLWQGRCSSDTASTTVPAHIANRRDLLPQPNAVSALAAMVRLNKTLTQLDVSCNSGFGPDGCEQVRKRDIGTLCVQAGAGTVGLPVFKSKNRSASQSSLTVIKLLGYLRFVVVVLYCVAKNRLLQLQPYTKLKRLSVKAPDCQSNAATRTHAAEACGGEQ